MDTTSLLIQLTCDILEAEVWFHLTIDQSEPGLVVITNENRQPIKMYLSRYFTQPFSNVDEAVELHPEVLCVSIIVERLTPARSKTTVVATGNLLPMD